MAKTETTIKTATRSLEEIAADFAAKTDPGELRLVQARLAYEFIGSTEGKEAGELKEKFLGAVNVRLTARHTGNVSKPVIDNLLNTWKYMLRANAPQTGDVAKVAYNLASQGIAKKEDLFVGPAIKAILGGADPVETFVNAKKAIDDAKAAKKAEAEGQPNAGSTDPEISFDVLIAALGMITEEFFAGLDDEHKSILSTEIVRVADVVK